MVIWRASEHPRWSSLRNLYFAAVCMHAQLSSVQKLRSTGQYVTLTHFNEQGQTSSKSAVMCMWHLMRNLRLLDTVSIGTIMAC